VNASLRIGSVLGITIRVHVLLLAGVGFIILFAQDWMAISLMIATLFAIILLHELGHCIVALSFGLRVLDITLWPLGGIARMSEMPESAKVEGLIAVAGPIVNFILAAAMAPVWLWTTQPGIDRPLLRDFAFSFVLANLLMGAFNLIPAFPTDGGRILRAILAWLGRDWLRATEIAVKVGRFFAVLIGIGGVFLSFMAPVVALWLWWMGGLELRMVRARHAAPDPRAAFREFARRAADPGAVPPAYSPGPAAGPAPSAPQGGFSDADIERLERYRGPLRGFDPEA